MIELFTSIGLGGILIFVLGYAAIFWMAQVIDSRDPYNDEGDTDE